MTEAIGQAKAEVAPQRVSLSVAEYRAEVLALVEPSQAGEFIDLPDALGAVLAQPAASRVSIPPFANSAMDGYAVRFADVQQAGVTLPVVAVVAAGSSEDPDVEAGQCVRIMTGAPLPSFADTVVPVEDTDGGQDRVEIRRIPDRPGRHVRPAGDDVASGVTVVEAGTTLTASALGALAAAGMTQVAVRPRPVVATCATGDELVWDGSALRRGQIYESNSISLAALLARDGASVVRGTPIPDQPSRLAAWLDEVCVTADLVVLSGGVSVGAFDVVRDVLTDRANGTFRHVRMQPGKPQGWALWQQRCPVIALPGNPVSAVVSYEMFVRPVLDKMLGRENPATVTAVADAEWTVSKGRTQFVPVITSVSDTGCLQVRPTSPGGIGSHLVTSLVAAEALAVVPESVSAVARGDLLQLHWLR
jgi:molybdopterin molybdotransferase